MASRLGHRSAPGAPVQVAATLRATFAVLPPAVEHPGGQLRPGVAAWGEEQWALCGLVTNVSAALRSGTATVRSPDRIVDGLRGAFVAAVTDSGRIHLIRDPVGRRTVYCARWGDRWVFATEPKAIHRLPDFSPHLRPGAVAQYLTFSFIPGSPTMLEGLWEVPSGHYATLSPDANAPTFTPYFLPEHEETNGTRTDAEWVENFRHAFTAAVDELRPGSAPVAVFLSGGIDSSVVTAELAQRTSPVHTFAIHFGPRHSSECEFARMVAQRCGTEHHEILIRPKEFVPRLEKVVWHLDEPIGDPVAMPNFELAARTAEAGFRWVFNGEGGDPLFGGPKNHPMLLAHWYGSERPANFREQAYLASYRRAYEALDELLTPDFRSAIDVERDLEAVLRPFFEAARPTRFLDKLIAINARLKGAHLILPKVERMLGAWGLTPLSPLFDERLMALTFRLPGHLKLDHGVEKVVLKKAFADALPLAILDRPKSGMRVPVHEWFRTELRGYARRILNRRRLKADGIFRPEAVRRLLNYDNDYGAGRFGLRLWMLVTFHIWKDQVLAPRPAAAPSRLRELAARLRGLGVAGVPRLDA